MRKPSFFERLTGSMRVEDEDVLDILEENESEEGEKTKPEWLEDNEGELAVDVYQDEDSVIVKTMVAGVKPENLDVNVTRDMIIVRGERSDESDERDENYIHQELYWGSFSRTIMLPCEVEAEEATAKEEHGLLTITLPKIDKNKQTKLKVKSS